jgi:hypothetical protein
MAVPIKEKGVLVSDLVAGSSSSANASSATTGSAGSASATSALQKLAGNLIAVLGAASFVAYVVL